MDRLTVPLALCSYIKDLSLEEFYGSINIQDQLTDLQSKDREKIRSALQTLSAITGSVKRKDSLYALMGYSSCPPFQREELVEK